MVVRLPDYTVVIKFKPKFADAYVNRGLAYRILGRLDLAIEDYTTAIKLYPSDADIYNNRGVAYLNKSKFDLALQDFHTAIELKPDLVSVYVNRGLVYLSKNEVDQAIDDYNTAIRLDPQLARAYYNRGLARLYLKEWEKAKSDLTTARDIGLDIIASFHNAYGDIVGYERRNRVKLPADIAVMLTPQQQEARKQTSKNPMAQRIIEAVEKSYDVTMEDAETLLRVIKENQMSVRFDSPFEAKDQENQ